MILTTCAVASALLSWRWPLVGDAPLIHYVVFLMQHGMSPYLDIKDPNLPGTLAVEATIMHLFGPGALAWRVWDWTLTAIIGASIFAICRPYSRFAAVFAATLFALIHARDGLIELGQRDLLLTALLMLGYALLLGSLRDRRGLGAPTLVGIGAIAGIATLVKPVAALFVVGLVCRLGWTRRDETNVKIRKISAALLGFGVPVIAATLFLWKQHAGYACLDVATHLIPLHAAIWRKSPSYLLLQSVSSVVLPLFLLWLPVCLLRRSWRQTEQALLMVGAAVGILSFCVQGRGYPYHRYPSEAFLLTLMGLDFSAALRGEKRIVAALSWAAIVLAVIVTGPRSVSEVSRFDWQSNGFDDSLQGSLRQIGKGTLDHSVQCLDMAGGCINTLYRMGLVQSTGYLYDCYLFVPVASQRSEGEQQQYRAGFMAAISRRKPGYLIVTSDECGLGERDFLYRKLSYWPELDTLIEDQYSLSSQWTPTRKEGWQGRPVLPYGYRIYERKQAGE